MPINSKVIKSISKYVGPCSFKILPLYMLVDFVIGVAHELAKQADGTVEMVVWHESPSCIRSLLEADSNHVT